MHAHPNRHAALLPALLLGVILTPACQPSSPSSAAPAVELGQSLQAALDRVVAEHPGVPGAALCVDAPALHLHWEGAAGLADPGAGIAMSATAPVRIASNTKTFIAASILRLVEDGRLGLEDPIAGHLVAEHLELLVGGGYQPDRITVRHLLTHTSGLYDYTESDYFNRMVTDEPRHRWTRTEQLRTAMDQGSPWGAPGDVYHYADTGYILLGEILERTTGQPMPEAVRTLIGFDRLGLGSTWFETLEPEPEGLPAQAHQLIGGIDNAGYDPSFDLYGGGGLASTVGDLARFVTALFSGEVYHDPATLGTMLAPVEGVAAAADATSADLKPGAYRMGIWQAELGDHAVYRHTGFWGTGATRIPDLGATITVTVDQNQAGAAMQTLEQASLVALEQVAASAADTAEPLRSAPQST